MCTGSYFQRPCKWEKLCWPYSKQWIHCVWQWNKWSLCLPQGLWFSIMCRFLVHLPFIYGTEDSSALPFQEISRPLTSHRFGSPDMDDAEDEAGSYFISAVCWKSDRPTILTANSQGTIKVLVLAAWTREKKWNRMWNWYYLFPYAMIDCIIY